MSGVNTRKKILELGEDLVHKLGYNGFSYHHISKALNIKNAAIHYHFPSKEDLGEAIIAVTQDRFKKWINHPEHRIMPVKEQLEWFVKIYRYNLDRNNRVCLIGSLATDYYTLPNSMQQSVNRLSNDVLNWMDQLLHSGRAQGQLDFAGSSRSKAATVITSLTGSLQLARLLGNQLYQEIVDQIYVDLNLTY